jgi:hypothetical protein
MFEVDRTGLRMLLELRGKEFALYELVQNAWDQNVTEVKVSLTKPAGSRIAYITVEDDDPEGFADLSHAYTLFAQSSKNRIHGSVAGSISVRSWSLRFAKTHGL